MVGDQQNPGGAGSTGSVEVYWPGNNSFTEGPPLPREINEAAVVQTDGSFLLVGGVACCPEESADILRFDYDGWKWEVGNLLMGEISAISNLMEQMNFESYYFVQVMQPKLRVPRHGHVAFGLEGTPPSHLCGNQTTTTSTTTPTTSASSATGAPTVYPCLLSAKLSFLAMIFVISD